MSWYPSQILSSIQVEGEPAERMLQYLSFEKIISEEIKPKRSEEGATVSEETPGDVESVAQSDSVLLGICDDDLDPDEPSSSIFLPPDTNSCSLIEAGLQMSLPPTSSPLLWGCV